MVGTIEFSDVLPIPFLYHDNSFFTYVNALRKT